MSAFAISVVVIALNEAATIDACLERVSVLLREDGPGEVVVSDGGSVDGTAVIAERYAPVVTAPRGRANGLNAGAARATGDVLLFLHADTRLPPRALTAIRDALADARVAGGRFRLAFDVQSVGLRLTQRWINLRDALLGGYTGDQAVFVRRDVFERLGGFAPLPLMEDLDFARRLGRAGRVVRLREVVVTSGRRWRRHGALRTNLRMIVLRWLYYLGVPPGVLAPHYSDVR
ncbi:MAG TPA: TIGR04283 family arsenosugar biosynthesis glycosyltransferase [Chloroflexota bacterium]|nr:TIGR04283 family arsenosugar biosynthesis glycosyltransferase [Chloroflexota bacterium]